MIGALAVLAWRGPARSAAGVGGGAEAGAGAGAESEAQAELERVGPETETEAETDSEHEHEHEHEHERERERELKLVAYHCPQCGATVEIPDRGHTARCSYCEATIRVEGRKPARPAPARAKPRQREEPPPYVPPQEATLSSAEFGRFALTVLRQVVHEHARDALRFLPLDDRRAALFLLRVVKDPAQTPLADADLLRALSDAAVESLRARRDPGLAAKAALRALDARGAEGELEAFVAVFDAEQSTVLTYNAGCKGALIHCSIEEARTINVTRDRGRLTPIKLRGAQDVFANDRPVQLATGDGVVVTSAAVAGGGRGWRWGQGSTYRGLDKGWAGKSGAELALAVKDQFWEERREQEPPVGDLLVVGLTVRSNLEMRGADVDLAGLPPIRAVSTATFDVAFTPSGDAFVDVRELHGQRHALTWVEGASAEAGAKVADAVVALLDGTTGDNDNPRRGGREGLAAAGLQDAEVRACVLFLGDEHGKVGFWTRGWSGGFSLNPRGVRGASLQQFDEGGHAWPKPGGRFVLPGALPLAEKVAGVDDLARAWTGGKASSVYELCLHHEDHPGSEAFLESLRRAARVDAAEAPLDGLAVITRKPEL